MENLKFYIRLVGKRYPLVFGLQMILAVLIAAFIVGVMGLVQNVIDGMVYGIPQENVIDTVWMLLGIMVATMILSWIMQSNLSSITVGIKNQINERIMGSDIEVFTDRSQALVIYTQNFNEFLWFVRRYIPQTLQSFTIMGFAAVTVALFDFRLLLITLAGAVVFAVTIPINKRIHALEKENIVFSEKGLTRFGVVLKNKALFHFFPGSYLFFNNFKADLQAALKVSKQQAKLVALVNALRLGSNLIREMGIIIIGLFILQLPMGSLLVVMSLSSYLNGVVGAIVDAMVQFPRSLEASRRVDTLLNIPQEETVSQAVITGSSSLSATQGMTLQGVSYQYHEDKTMIYPELTLNLPTIAQIKGGVGTGKSTLIKMLSGLYGPKTGQILLDGKASDIHQRRQLTAVVDQDAFIFEGSLVENISMFDDHPDEARINRLLEEVNLKDWANEREGGIHSALSGDSVSGGQRQRIAICRALYKDAEIIILDEATASLDKENEEAIKNLIQTIVKKYKKTALIIDHEGYFAKIAEVSIQLTAS